MLQDLVSTDLDRQDGKRVEIIFVVLCASDGMEKQRFSIRRLFEKRESQIDYVNVDKIRFAVITWPGSFLDIDWEEIAEMTGRAGRRLVLPRQVEPPEELGLCRLSVWEYADALARHFVLQCMQQAPLPLYRKSIGLVDMRGVGADFVRKAVRHATIVRVSTANKAMYDGVAEEMMDTYGASVLVSQNQDDAYRSGVVYAPHGLVDQHSDEILPPIVTIDKTNIRGHGRVISGFHQVIPEQLLALKPPLIEESDFLAALWQLCGMRELASLPIDWCICNGNPIPAADVSEYMARIQQKER